MGTQFKAWNQHERIGCRRPACAPQVLKCLLEAAPGLSTPLLPLSSMLRMSSDNSLSDMLEVHQPVPRPAMPTECPPAPANTSTPTVSSRLSTTSLTPSTDSELPEPTFPSPVLPPLLNPLPLQFSTFPFPSLLKTPLRLLLPRLSSLLPTMPLPLLPPLPPRRLLRGRDVMLMRKLPLLLLLSLSFPTLTLVPT